MWSPVAVYANVSDLRALREAVTRPATLQRLNPVAIGDGSVTGRDPVGAMDPLWPGLWIAKGPLGASQSR
jgi:hypothetical protein